MKYLVSLLIVVSVNTTFAQSVPVFQWAKTIASDQNDTPEGIATDPQGNIYTIGTFSHPIDLDPGPGTFILTPGNGGVAISLYISKVDVDGNFVWGKQFTTNSTGAPLDNKDFGIAVGSGGVYITGTMHNNIDFDPGPGVHVITTFVEGIFVAKLTLNGDFVWAHGFDTTGYEYGNNLVTDAAGNVYVIGTYADPIDFDPGAGVVTLTSAGRSDAFLLKLDTNGNFVWVKSVGGTEDDFGNALGMDPAGNIYATGSFSTSGDFDPGPGVQTLNAVNTLPDIFVLKLDASGNYVWAKSFGGSSLEEATDIHVDATGNTYSTGSFYASGDFDPGPAVLTLTSKGDADAFVVKLNSDGTLGWVKTFGSIGVDTGSDVVSDATGNVYTVGTFRQATDFDPGTGVFNMTPFGCCFQPADGFIQKLDAAGNFMWARSIGAQNNDLGKNLAIDVFGSIIMSGNYATGLTDFDWGPCVFSVSSVGGADSYLLKFKEGTSTSPTITSFAPQTSPIGSSVIITGTNFSPVIANNAVKFFNNRTAVITAATATSLTVTVPTGTTTGVISVTSGCTTVTTATNFSVGTPEITITLQPEGVSGCVGEQVTFTTAATGTTNIVYQWQVSPTSDASFDDLVDGNGVSGSGTPTLTITVTPDGEDFMYRCRIDGDGAGQEVTQYGYVGVETECGSNTAPEISDEPSAVVAGGTVSLSLLDLISDDENNVDFESLYYDEVSEQGATVTLKNQQGQYELLLDYNGIDFVGTDHVTVGVCDSESLCVEQELTIEVSAVDPDPDPNNLIVYNAISPDGNGLNDFLFIQYLDAVPGADKNHMTIVNRWGDVVFETDNYNNTDRVFIGKTNKGHDLPSGIYYYRFSFNGTSKELQGYLSLKR